ncbi:RNA-binding S4 domain-containing protein [Dongia soli]|uniref:RNA-binding S4 domain-containing protein n=1 Tax=Dongia soli TaxID=600628 RepID=A0ABU5E8V1_9PROT|nr:RNA-binding S4 domain-containing protein [Dongia soli]MDY0882189.1 RNA-binding S4 domain-containing protein [Dongia soli]
MTDAAGDTSSLRLDKWLWFARFVKSRSLASRLVEEGRMRVNNVPTAKAHYAIRPGDVLTFALGPHIRVIRVVALGQRRGPAVEAQQLYLDLDPPMPRKATTPDADNLHDEDLAAGAHRDAGSGRPTKRERRAITRLQGDD